MKSNKELIALSKAISELRAELIKAEVEPKVVVNKVLELYNLINSNNRIKLAFERVNLGEGIRTVEAERLKRAG